MTKFSKKLVSKCIYIQILKCTETELLGLFMGSGGWLLVHMWLTESIVAKNWPLVRELLELLLLCPVDIERLKTNNCPKLVKELSKDGNQFGKNYYIIFNGNTGAILIKLLGILRNSIHFS